MSDPLPSLLVLDLLDGLSNQRAVAVIAVAQPVDVDDEACIRSAIRLSLTLRQHSPQMKVVVLATHSTKGGCRRP
jgi:hypothetical protein